jgi:hypothetical protein
MAALICGEAWESETMPIWFKSKRYGWGWTPLTWQGWVVTGAYVGLIVLSAVAFPPRQSTFAFVASVLGLSVVLVTICWIKGEPPKWRWGDGSQ